MAGDDQGRFLVEDIADGGGEAREPGVEFGVDSIAEAGILAHQVATMAGQEPELTVGRVEEGIDQSEAVDGGRERWRRGRCRRSCCRGRPGVGISLEASGWTIRASKPAAVAASRIGR